MCKKIHRGGNAEQYHADKKYKEAVAVAVEACAEDIVSEGLDNESVEDLTEGKKVLEDIYPRARRIMGAEHPFTMKIQVTLKMMRDHDI